jgi:Asp-tRNA(Asn)/Glu-tRNA(Gln) amidotransferase A subunit family amidase
MHGLKTRATPREARVAKMSRRKVVKGIITTGLLGASGRMNAATTTSSTTQTDAITPDDLASLEKITGRHFTPKQREMMVENASAKREVLVNLRNRKIDPNIEPAVRFDPRIPAVSYPSGSSSCVMSDGPEPACDGNIESLAFATVAQLSRLIFAKKITSTQLTTMYLDRLKRIGPRLNCVITLTEELALEQAKRADEELANGKSRGPLHGIPWGAKDLLATKDIRTSWGVKPYAERTFDEDATAVKRLEEAGAVLVAKLSMGELAMGDVWFKGMTRNPWKPSTGSSGSSAGPGAATAAGLVAFAIGSETLGSIISPCITNGVTGLRPTYGRVSRYGAMALARTMDKLGPMARGVEDCALILSAIHGPDGCDPTAANVPFNWNGSTDLKALRVGIAQADVDNALQGKDDEKNKMMRAAIDKVRQLVGELKPIRLPPTKNYTGLASLTIACESACNFMELVDSDQINELVQQDAGSWPNVFRVGSTIPAADYLRAQQVRTQLQHAMHEAMTDVDCYVTFPYAGPTVSYTNLTGHPSLVTRCGMFEGLPLSIEFVGDLYREDAILHLGLTFEQATEWHKQWPDTTKIPELNP